MIPRTSVVFANVAKSPPRFSVSMVTAPGTCDLTRSLRLIICWRTFGQSACGSSSMKNEWIAEWEPTSSRRSTTHSAGRRNWHNALS